MEELKVVDEEHNEEYEIEYGASNIINRNKIEKREVDEMISHAQFVFRAHKKAYGEYNRKIKKLNMFVLWVKEKFELMKVEKRMIIQEMNDLIQAISKNEEHNEDLDEKQHVYKKLTMEYLTLDKKSSEQEQVVTMFSNDIHALNDLILDATNIISALKQNIEHTEKEIGQKRRELLNSTRMLKSKSIKLQGEEISKEKKNALTFQIQLLNIEIRMKTDRVEEMRAFQIRSIEQLELREFDLGNKKNDKILLIQNKYIACKKEIAIKVDMEKVNKKMSDLREEIIDMKILQENVSKLASLQHKLDNLLEVWKVLVEHIGKEYQVIEVLTAFITQIMLEKYKLESVIPILNKKRDCLVDMIDQMSKLKLRN